MQKVILQILFEWLVLLIKLKNWMATLAADAGKPLVTCTDGIAPLKLDYDGYDHYARKNTMTPQGFTVTRRAAISGHNTKQLKGVDQVYLASDPDREGEAIAWHIAEALGEQNHRFHRVLLLELTPKAIKAALAKPVALNRPRYDSQQARRILDRIVGRVFDRFDGWIAYRIDNWFLDRINNRV